MLGTAHSQAISQSLIGNAAPPVGLLTDAGADAGADAGKAASGRDSGRGIGEGDSGKRRRTSGGASARAAAASIDLSEFVDCEDDVYDEGAVAALPRPTVEEPRGDDNDNEGDDNDGDNHDGGKWEIAAWLPAVPAVDGNFAEWPARAL